MATDTPISGLPSNPGVASNDVVEVLDVSNTTNQATGENTKATIASLISGLPAFVAAGASHAAGLVPDPGSTSHATPYLLGDDGQFHQVAGSGVSYGASTFTISGGGGATSPGGNSGDVQYNSSGSFAGASLSTLIDTALGTTRGSILYRGGTGWAELAPGTSGYFLKSQGAGADPVFAAVTASPGGAVGQLQYNCAGALGGAANWALGSSGELVGTAIADPASPASGSLWISGTSGNFSYISSGLVNRPGGQIWSALSSLTAVANSTAQTSILTGGTTIGTLTFPANSLTAGKTIACDLFGAYSCTGSPTLTVKIMLGSTVIATATCTLTTAETGAWWYFVVPLRLQIQEIGSNGKAICTGAVGPGGNGSGLLTTGTSPAATSQVTVNTTGSLAFDIQVQWSAANSGNSIQVNGGSVYLQG